MLKTNVRITGKLEDFIRSQVGNNGLYETTSEYLRDLIRKDMEKKEDRAWAGLREELLPAMQASNVDFIEVSASDVIKRNKKK